MVLFAVTWLFFAPGFVGWQKHSSLKLQCPRANFTWMQRSATTLRISFRFLTLYYKQFFTMSLEFSTRIFNNRIFYFCHMVMPLLIYLSLLIENFKMYSAFFSPSLLTSWETTSLWFFRRFSKRLCLFIDNKWEILFIIYFQAVDLSISPTPPPAFFFFLCWGLISGPQPHMIISKCYTTELYSQAPYFYFFINCIDSWPYCIIQNLNEFYVVYLYGMCSGISL